MDSSPLILIKASGEAIFARARSEKDEAIKQFNSGAALLLWAWMGQYRTDIFVLTAEDIKNYYQ